MMKNFVLKSKNYYRSVLIIIITIAFVSLLVGCDEYSLGTEDSIINNNTVADTGNEEVGEVDIFCNNKNELGKIFGADLTQTQITDIRLENSNYEFTEIYIFFTGNAVELRSGKYDKIGFSEHMLENKNIEELGLDGIILGSGKFSQMELDDIIRGNIVTLENVGLGRDDVQAYWVNYREINDGEYISPYQVDLYLLKEPRDDGSNMLLYAVPNATVQIDVENIMAE